jgi:ATP-dependent Zn protease
MNSAATAATAHHEAGHAVAAIVRGVRVKHATIAPSGNRAGHIRLLGRVPTQTGAMHDRGMIALAGEAAQRRFSPRSVRRHHGGSDREAVRRFALDASGSAKVAQCLVDLWQAQADDLVQARWATIQRIAAALLERQTIDGAELRRLVFMPEKSSAPDNPTAGHA